ncbi:MAG: tetratricopeptide repeat protein [Phycisphaerales bacterium]|nr:tetratricopeptide repeat protein [Phycisphaerales bacterium]
MTDPADPDSTLLPVEAHPNQNHGPMDVTSDATGTVGGAAPAAAKGFSMDSKSWGGTAIGTGVGPASPRSGARYKILSQLGEGGFGIVYLAEQTEPVRRKVALKVLKMAFASPATLARFTAEQQALAIMDHPGLAKVFDAGTTPEGQPYFAMEYAPGEPLATFCDHRRADLRQRLALLAQICDAIQHAHMKGVVHRDLKPGNILVGETDEGFRPKVIDFGIAKAVSASVGDRPLETQFGQFVGTPVYMSPEQAEGGTIDIDTRSDIYSMGVILYELLVGKTPIESETLRKSGIAHLHRTLLETEPLRPSVRLEKMARDERTAICAARQTEFAPLLRQLKRDLDWITMRCLEKDRTRRYESAGALAADLRRFLDGEAVLAGPPGKGYRIHKFVRRHRIAVTAGVSALVGLITFGVVVTIAWQDAVRQQQRAQQTLKVFTSSLKVSDVTGGGAKTVNTIVDLLEVVEGTALVEMKDQPDILTELRETIGPLFTTLKSFDAAERNTRCVVEYRRAHREESGETSLAALASALHEYGRALYFLKRYGESRDAYLEALTFWRELAPNGDAMTAHTLSHLGSVYAKLGETAQSDRYADEALTMYRKLGNDDREFLAKALYARANSLYAANRLEESRKFANEFVEVTIHIAGKDDWKVGRGLALLGDLEFAEGRFDLAVIHQRRALDLTLPRLGPIHATTSAAQHKLAQFLTAEATGTNDPTQSQVVRDPALIAEAIDNIRLAIDGRRQDGSQPVDLAKALELLSRLSELRGDIETSIASERQIVSLLRERAPQAAEQILNAQKRLVALTSQATPTGTNP